MTIPTAFTLKKERILKNLAAPDAEYSDLSPKGSVDDGIQDLIKKINELEGVVTTSSCAGRISVFLEGSQAQQSNFNDEDAETSDIRASQSFVPGGKGNGGKWLFVSHHPVPLPARDVAKHPLTALFSLSPPHQCDMPHLDKSNRRLIKLQFEPMILHIMTASLRHAKPVLSAAINAGFRESGVQSLRNLDDANAFPMVAVRTFGLALSSVIGFAKDDEDDPCNFASMIDEMYLRSLTIVANERFRANSGRIERFLSHLLNHQKVADPIWEKTQVRRERKRAEGLRRQREVHESKTSTDRQVPIEESLSQS